MTSSPPGGQAVVRRFPYPFRAFLAICSDLDETPDRNAYAETMRFLNTGETTSMGPGVDLEIGNSIYFDMPPDQFAYWTTDDAGRAMVRDLIRSGHIDCLHSYGDVATSRGHAGRALDELSRHGCRLEVWVDHAVAPTNFGADIMRGSGDLPGSEAYHADLTCDFGVRYVWRGRVTSVIGQDVPRNLGGVFSPRHPIGSARTIAKELAKGLLARAGSVKYAMHGSNDTLREIRLRDGRPAQELLRCNPYWEAVDRGETADGLAEVLTRPMLERLVEREGVCVLYTHLGKIRDRCEPLRSPARCALRLLAEEFRAGRVLVATTRRLLRYREALRKAHVAASADGEGLRVDLTGADRGRLEGLTLYVADPGRTRVMVDGNPVEGLRPNPPDHTGRPSVSLPWRPLVFPRL